MYKAIFDRRDSDDVYQTITETNADLDTLFDTVLTNVEGIDKWQFLEDLVCKLYKQVDGEWQMIGTGTEHDAYRAKWQTEWQS